MSSWLQAGFLLVATLGFILAIVGAFGRRLRRVLLGILLVSVVFPAWMIASGGSLARGRAFVFVTPPGSANAVARLLASCPPRSAVAVVEIAPPTGNVVAEHGALDLRWRAAERVLREGGGATAVVSATRGWLEKVARSSRLGVLESARRGFPRATVVVPLDGSDFWESTAAAASIDITSGVAAVRNAGAHVLTVDISASAIAAGQLRLSITGPRVAGSGEDGSQSLRWLALEADLCLENSPYQSIDGKYVLKAWLDRRSEPDADGNTALAELSPEGSPPPNLRELLSVTTDPGDSFERAILVGERPEDPRRTAFGLSWLTRRVGDDFPDVVLKPGFHRLEVELSFVAAVGARRLPVVYSASEYFEMSDAKLVVIERRVPLGLNRLAWIHRSAADDSRRPSVAAMMKEIVRGEKRFSHGNNGRIPFSRVRTYTADEIDTLDRRTALEKDLADAAMVLLVEPGWNTIQSLDTDAALRGFCQRGGVVLVVGPPAPPQGVQAASAPAWLPAVGEAVETAGAGPGALRAAVDEYTDAIVYFVPDVSRPASKFRAATGNMEGIGASLQAQVINKVYEDLGVTDRAGAPINDPVKAPGGPLEDPTLAGAVGIGLFTSEERPGLIVPPLFARTATTQDAVRAGMAAAGPVSDLAPSWVASRLWTVAAGSREALYADASALSSVAISPCPIDEADPAELDLPLDLESRARRTTVVVFALDVAQPVSLVDPWSTTEGRVWTLSEGKADVGDEAATVDPIQLTKTGAKLLIVPIRLNSKLTETYNNSFANGQSLKEAAAVWNAEVLSDDSGAPVSLNLSGTDDDALTSVAAVATRLIARIRAQTAASAGELLVRDSARAITLGTTPSVEAPRVWRHLVPAQDPSPSAAAVLRAGPEETEYPAVIWRPVGNGSAIALAYSPCSFDMWWRDLGPSFETGLAAWQGRSPPDGWGLQRLCDPLLLSGRPPAPGLVIEHVQSSKDETCLVLTCRLPIGASLFDLPAMTDGTRPEARTAGVVTVSDIDVQQRRVTLTATTADDKPLEGSFNLQWGELVSNRTIFARLKPAQRPTLSARNALERIAEFAGGAAVPESGFADVLPTSFQSAWLGSVSLVMLVTLMLSPAVRRWRPLRLRRRRTTGSFLAEASEEVATLEAALDASGLEFGTACAQRPAGRTLQVRPARTGDSPLAARRSDWAFFVDEIAMSLGSSPMPRVIETPRLESLSILTLLDVHPGAMARDVGVYSDRVRAMSRVAVLNSLIAQKRGGAHYVLALQMPCSRDAAEAATSETGHAVVGEVCRSAAALGLSADRHRSRTVPELLPGEAVVLVTNPAADIDETIQALTRKCVEDRCSLGVVFLIHPMQSGELGMMRQAGGPAAFALMDRNDLSTADVEAYLERRIERLTAKLSIGDGRAVVVRTDQPAGEMVTVLSDGLWVHL